MKRPRDRAPARVAGALQPPLRGGLRYGGGAGLLPQVFDFTGGTMPAGATLTRASAGTYVDSAGVLRTAAVDEPRFDHDPDTLELLGLLVEPQRINRVLSSEAVTTTAALWQLQNGTLDSNVAMAPDGTLSADKYIPNSTNTPTHLLQLWWQNSYGFVPPADTAFSFSVFCKPAGYRWLQLGGDNFFSGGSTKTLWADLENQLIGVTGAQATGAWLSRFKEGWSRVSLGWITRSTPAIFDSCAGVKVAAANGSNPAFAGNGSDGVYTWGWQLEEGSFPTSYIPNSSSTATAIRARDELSLGLVNASWRLEVTMPSGVFEAVVHVSEGQGYSWDWDDFGAPTERHILQIAAEIT